MRYSNQINREVLNIWQMMSIDQIHSNFYNCFPEYVERVPIESVNMDNIACPVCNEITLGAFFYRLDGEDIVEPLQRCCKKCEDVDIGEQAKRDWEAKKELIDNRDWFHCDTQIELKHFTTYDTCSTRARSKAIAYGNRTIQNGEIISLVIAGKTGTGKTLIAKALANGFKRKGETVAFLSAMELFRKIKATFGDAHAERKFYEQFAKFSCVVIDDIGLEKMKANDTGVGWVESQWTKLIELRQGKITIYTTNLDEIALGKSIGERAFSRMLENAAFIETWDGSDYRHKKKVDL